MTEHAAPIAPTARRFPWRPVGVFLYFSGAAAAAKLAHDHHLPWPRCWIRELTGIPCQTCGGTRSLLAMTRLDLASALRINPLFTLACVTLTFWLAAALSDSLLGTRALDQVRAATKRWPVWWILVGLLFLNWLYLCRYLPR